MDIDYSKQADRYLEKQTAQQSARIRHAIDDLPAGDVKKLKGIINGYRLRIGSVRILFEKEGNKIDIVKTDNRGDVYK
jgi:mRNA interferase RelE/StbE